MQRGAREQVRLKHRHHAPARKCLSRRGQRRGHFAGVVGVVVHHRHTRCFSQPLEPPAHARERRERPRARLEVRIDRRRRGECRRRVAQVVHAGDAQRELDAAPTRQRDRGARSVGSELRLADPDVGVRAEPHAPDRYADPRRYPPRSSVVAARDHALRAAREFDERVFQRRHRAVTLEVVGLDVVHDRHGRRER